MPSSGKRKSLTSDRFVNWAITALDVMAAGAVEWIGVRGDMTCEPSDDRACVCRSAHRHHPPAEDGRVHRCVRPFRDGGWLNISNVRSACSRVRSGLNQPSLGASPTWASSSGGTPHATRIRTGRPRASEHLILAQESRLIWRIEQPSLSAAT